MAVLRVSEETPIPEEGGFPTPAELDRLHNTMLDLLEFGFGRVRDRAALAWASAYEEKDGRLDELPFDFVGRWAAITRNLRWAVDDLSSEVARLQGCLDGLIDIAANGGEVMFPPPFGRGGDEYEPSPEAGERWGLTGAR